MLMTMMSNWMVGFLINWCHFWSWAIFGVVLSKSLRNGRWTIFWITSHALVCNVIYHTTEVIDNRRLLIFHRCNNWGN